jgi:hypothetical protein
MKSVPINSTDHETVIKPFFIEATMAQIYTCILYAVLLRFNDAAYCQVLDSESYAQSLDQIKFRHATFFLNVTTCDLKFLKALP